MEISKMVTVSTCHISEETNNMLADKNNSLPISVYDKTDYGWFIYMPADKDNDADVLKALPTDLAVLFMFARYNEVDVICLDCDGEEIDGLPIYNW